MDGATLAVAIAMAKQIPGTAANEAIQAAKRAEEAAETVEQHADSIKKYEATGIIVQDGKLCVAVERS